MPTFTTPGPIVVTLDIETGHVRIVAGERTDTVVGVRPSDESEDADVRAAEQTRVEYANGQLLVQTPKSKIRSIFGRTPLVDVTISLPSDSRVEAKGSADFRSEGRLGESTFETGAGSIRLDQTARVKLKTAAGDISVGRSTGHTEATTASGKIWLGVIEGTAVAKTSNGDITVGEVTGDVQLNTAIGDITVKHALAAVGAKSAYGSIRIGEVVRGSVVLESNYGGLELGIRQGTAAWLDALSKHGSVRSDLDTIDAPESSDETVKVHARTGYGDIVVRRS